MYYTPDCKTSTNDNINPHLSSFRARDRNCCCDWSPQVRHVEETACLSPPRKPSLFASDRGNVWLSIDVALWALEMSPLYFPNVHREALWSSRAGGGVNYLREARPGLFLLKGRRRFIFQPRRWAGCVWCLFRGRVRREQVEYFMHILLLDPKLLLSQSNRAVRFFVPTNVSGFIIQRSDSRMITSQISLNSRQPTKKTHTRTPGLVQEQSQTDRRKADIIVRI